MIWFIVTYSVVFSVGCFFYVNYIYKKLLYKTINKIDRVLLDQIVKLNEITIRAQQENKRKQEESLEETKKEIKKNTAKNLNQLNTDISNKLDKLANNISKRPIV